MCVYNIVVEKDEQRDVFRSITNVVENQRDGVFLYGYGGTRKTYMWRTLACYIRSQKYICLTIASLGITSILLPGGQTTHLMFKIPIPTLESSTGNVEQKSDRAELLKLAKLIILDEALMDHKYFF